MNDSSPLSVALMFRMVACHLRETRKGRRNEPIKAETIDQYISHMSSLLSEQGWPHCAHIRSPTLKMVLKGFHREDLLANPKRLTSSIPATAAVMAIFFTIAARVYAFQPRKSAEVQAAAALTYYLALRANEGAAKSVSTRDRDEDTPDTQDAHHPATEGTPFPTGQHPTSVDVLQDSTKTSQARGSSHRSAHLNPRPDKQPFCVVSIVWEYIQRFPPPRNGAFFPTTLSSDTTAIMKLTAIQTNLDPTRLSARCLRSGSVTMLRNMKHQLIEAQELVQIRDHGQWSGNDGERTYSHDSPDARKLLVAPSLYDAGFMTIAYLVWFYMTPR
jgi:hypothetical protein